jgi:trimeric autotransporter adhesin
MATIVTRTSKLSALTTQEMDDNFTNLKTEVEQATADITSIDVSGKLNSASGTATGTLSAENITATGTVQAATLTDGTLSSTAGAITGATSITATGTVQAATLTDGTLSSTAGAITGATSITATGDIQCDNLVNTDLKGYGEVMLTTSPATGAISLDLSAANIFRLDLTGNVTVTFTNPPAAGSTSVATIIAIQDVSGGHAITWTGGAYAGGTPPPASTGSNEVDIWTVFTYDQGTSYVVSLSMKDVS